MGPYCLQYRLPRNISRLNHIYCFENSLDPGINIIKSDVTLQCIRILNDQK